jgi:hypothetical protein
MYIDPPAQVFIGKLFRRGTAWGYEFTTGSVRLREAFKKVTSMALVVSSLKKEDVSVGLLIQIHASLCRL